MIAEQNIFTPVKDKLQACIHCGLCLDFCPTYRVTSEEMSSPRGRIYLMKAVADGELSIDDPLLIKHELSCLVCRACETACPSGVEFSVLMEHTREAIVTKGSRGFFNKFIYTTVIGSKTITKALQIPLALLSKTRFPILFKKTFTIESGIFSSINILPDEIPFPKTRPLVYKTSKLNRRGSVGLLIGCIGDVFTRSVNDATITVLNSLGYDVLTLPEINCCGSLAAHSGYLDQTRSLANNLLETIEQYDIDAFITNVAGCGAMMKDYQSVLHDAPHSEAISKIKDISEFLFDRADEIKELRLRFDEPTRISYQAPCHLYHGQKIIDTPARLLSLIENAEVSLLEENDICCGSAGTYNIEHPEMSAVLLKRKMELISQNGSEIVTTANSGCLMQLRSGLDGKRNRQQVYHFIEVIASRIS